ncbi:MAG: hypothetical protein Q9172_006397, partial [Xanthocarpia lactea]
MTRLGIPFLCALLLASESVVAQQFTPRGDIGYRYGTQLERRQSYTCQPATPDVSEEAVFRDACNENPQNSLTVCFNTLVRYAQISATDTCSRYYTLYNNCLVLNDYSETVCADARAGYVYCSNYTLQAYAYCGCYFVEPDQIFNCANVELQINGGSGKMFGPAPSSTILSSALLNGPIAPSSATLSNIPTSVPTNVPLFSPRQSSSLVAASTAFITSTTVVTSCTSDGVTNCPATTIVSSAAVVSSTWTCGPEGCIIPPSSLPPIIKIATDTPLAMECPPGSCDIPSYISIPTDYMVAPDETPLPTAAAAITSSSPGGGGGIPVSAGTLPTTAIPTITPSSMSQKTTTSLSTVAITRTSTITT